VSMPSVSGYISVLVQQHKCSQLSVQYSHTLNHI